MKCEWVPQTSHQSILISSSVSLFMMRRNPSSILLARKSTNFVRREFSAEYTFISQVKVTGGGDQLPASKDLVSIPGVYDNVVFPDIWAPSFHTFTVPGPAVAFSSNGATDSTGSSPPTASSTPSSAHTTHAPSTSSSHVSTTQSTHAPTVTHSASSTHVSASSQVSATSSTGQCRSGRKVRRHAKANAKRHVRHNARDKHHH